MPYFNDGMIFSGYLAFLAPFIIKKKDLNLKKIYYIPYFLIIIFSTISIALNNASNYRIIKLLIFIPFIFWSAKLFITRLFKDKSQMQIFKIIIIFGLINSLFSYLCFFSITFRDFFYSIVYVNPKLFEYPIFRPSGLLYDGSSYASVLYSIFIIITINYYKNCVSNKERIFSLLCFSVFMINILFLGRFGLLIILSYLIFFFIKNFSLNKISLKIVFFIITILSIIFLLLNQIDSKILNYFEWSTNFVNLIFDSNKSITDDTSVKELLNNHFNLNMTFFEWIFGSNKILNKISLDPGIIRLIAGYGLIVTIIFYSHLFLLIYHIKKSTKINQTTKDISLAILFIIVVANFKDFYIFSPYSIYFLLFLIIESSLKSNLNIKPY